MPETKDPIGTSTPEMPGRKTAREIGGQLRLLNLITGFVVLALLAVVLSFSFDPLDSILGYSTRESVVWITLLTGMLAVVAIIFSTILKRRVVAGITEYSEGLHALLRVTREIKDEIYGDILLEKILQSALTLTGSEAGSILLTQGEGLVFKTVKGEKSSGLLNREVSLDKGVAGWAAQHGAPVLIADAGNDERFDPYLDRETGFLTRSVLAVPLVSGDRTAGVIELLNKAGGPFSHRDLETVNYLADQAAISLERARFYEDERNFQIHVTNLLFETIDSLTPLNEGHSKRVARYCNMLVRNLGLPDERARRLHIAALLHDIGFIRIPLDRSGDPAFFRKHPGLGHDLLAPITFYADLAPMILHHHERFDGTGYPGGLGGEQIPLESRILAIAEVFDAITNPTSYAAPRSVPEAVQELLDNAGTQFDPDLVVRFVEEVGKEEISPGS